MLEQTGINFLKVVVYPVRMKPYYACILFAALLTQSLGISWVAFAEQDRWTRKADMPTARYGLSSSVVDGKIYAIGGTTDWQDIALAVVEEYDPATDTWSRKANMPPHPL